MIIALNIKSLTKAKVEVRAIIINKVLKLIEVEINESQGLKVEAEAEVSKNIIRIWINIILNVKKIERV